MGVRLRQHATRPPERVKKNDVFHGVVGERHVCEATACRGFAELLYRFDGAAT
jgi:hypothetical protein